MEMEALGLSREGRHADMAKMFCAVIETAEKPISRPPAPMRGTTSPVLRPPECARIKPLPIWTMSSKTDSSRPESFASTLN
jgi:hypothetical protein